MTVLERDTQGLDGWWLCSLHGRQGIVPGNRLKILVPTGPQPPQPQPKAPAVAQKQSQAQYPPTPQDVYQVPPSINVPSQDIYQVPPTAGGPCPGQDVYQVPPSMNQTQDIYQIPPSIERSWDSPKPMGKVGKDCLVFTYM
ncbi:hypothetical protein PO909_031990 [Leuciscus waleckii]